MARPVADISPRIWSAAAVAKRLGMSSTTFAKRQPELVRAGFPNRDAILQGWDAVAVERWLDARAGLSEHAVLPRKSGLDAVQW